MKYKLKIESDNFSKFADLHAQAIQYSIEEEIPFPFECIRDDFFPCFYVFESEYDLVKAQNLIKKLELPGISFSPCLD